MDEEITLYEVNQGLRNAERYANEIKVALLQAEWKEIGKALSTISTPSDDVKALLFFIECM